MRLIDADALSAKMAKYIEENRNESDLFLNGCADGAYHYQFAVGHAPTIEERKTGKWVNDEHDIPHCSCCQYIPTYDTAIDDIYYSPYCPNCGAKMEVDE